MLGYVWTRQRLTQSQKFGARGHGDHTRELGVSDIKCWPGVDKTQIVIPEN
jgi:hypothetical protein